MRNASCGLEKTLVARRTTQVWGLVFRAVGFGVTVWTVLGLGGLSPFGGVMWSLEGM